MQDYVSRFVTPYERAEIVTMDKELVEWLLSINTHNRKPMPSVIRAYKEEMLAGRWVLISQGIGISKDGVLLDGQHRLYAMRAAGYPALRMVIVSGLDASSQLKIDTHAKRTVANIISLAINVATNSTLAACLRIISRLDDGAPQKAFEGKPPIEDLLVSYERHASVIQQFTIDGKRDMSAGFWSAVLYSIENGAPIESVQSFVNSFTTGENLSKNSPILRLRNRAMEMTVSGGKTQKVWFCYVARALSAYLHGQEIAKLYCPELEDAVKMLKECGKEA